MIGKTFVIFDFFFDSSALANTRPGKKRSCIPTPRRSAFHLQFASNRFRETFTHFLRVSENPKSGSLGTGMYTVTVVGTILVLRLFIFFVSRFFFGTAKRPILSAHISFPLSVAQACLSLFFVCVYSRNDWHTALKISYD